MAQKWARWAHKPCRLEFPTASDRGAETEVAHKSARWLHKPIPPGGSPPLQIGGQIHRWPTSGQGGYITPAARGVPTASERGAEAEVAHKWARWSHKPCRLEFPTASDRGAESEVAHKWARWLHNPCRLWDAHCFRWGGGAQSEVADKWARWLHNPCHLGGPHRFRAGGRNRGGLQVGKVAT